MANVAERVFCEFRWTSPAVSIDQYPPRPFKWHLTRLRQSQRLVQPDCGITVIGYKRRVFHSVNATELCPIARVMVLASIPCCKAKQQNV